MLPRFDWVDAAIVVAVAVAYVIVTRAQPGDPPTPLGLVVGLLVGIFIGWRHR